MKKIQIKSVILIKDGLGIEIHTPGNGFRKIRWADVSQADMKGGKAVVLTLKDTTTISINDKKFSDYLPFIKAIPGSVPQNRKLADFKRDYFSSLTCCAICGKKAVKATLCLCCRTLTYEGAVRFAEETDDTDDLLSEKEYIRTNQLQWFDVFEEEEKVDFYPEDPVFEPCAGWVPSVTEYEVIEYGKVNSQSSDS